MISLAYHEKGHKIPLMSIALSSMIRKRYIWNYFWYYLVDFLIQQNRLVHSFFIKMKVELLEGGTFWLSESPSVPGSFSWGSEVPCIATWAISLWFRKEIITSIVYELCCTFVTQSLKSFGSLTWCIVHTFQLKGVEPPGFSFQIVNTNMDQFSPRARRRSALLTWQHIASLPPSLPVVYCGGFNTQKESTTGRFLLGRSR